MSLVANSLQVLQDAPFFDTLAGPRNPAEPAWLGGPAWLCGFGSRPWAR